MRKLITYIVFAMLLMSFAAAQSNVNDKFIKGQNITINSSSPDNLYIFGADIQVLQNVNGDFLAAGSNMLIEGNIFDDLTTASGNIEVNGNVGGDARIAAGSANINSAVFGDLVVFAGTVVLSESSVVGRDVLIRSGTVTLNGIINGDVDVSSGTVTINGLVDGDAKIKSSSLNFGENAIIKGDLIVPNTINVDESKVQGKIVVNPELFSKSEPKAPGVWAWISFFLFLIIVGIVLLLIAGNYSEKATYNIIKKPVSSFFIGFFTLLLVPVLIFLLLITIIGIPLALLLLVAYGLLIILGIVIAAMMIGKLLYSLFDTETPRYKGLFVGALGFIILLLIPLLGVLAFIYLESTAIGGLVRAPWQKPLKKRRKK